MTQCWLLPKEAEQFFGVRNLYAYRVQLVLKVVWTGGGLQLLQAARIHGKRLP
jgi:hypothetical protein